MPPRAKFTREEIVSAALALVREKGTECVTARELGARLNSSARPIFTLFKSMDEVLAETERAAREIYNGYVREGLKEPLAFKGVGRAYIRFAKEEPKLFQVLFMRETGEGLGGILPALDENYPAIVQSVAEPYGLSRSDAEALYKHLWIYTHGIASLSATRVCSFSEEETDGMLTEVFIALLKARKAGAK